jgi:acetylornithine/LysW-gamma-L-lysine aminotransferase
MTVSTDHAVRHLFADLTPEEINAYDRDHQVSLYAKREIALVRGEGAYLYDAQGRRYLDAMSNYGVAVLGHADPIYAAALSEQLQQLATCHQSFGNDVRSAALRAIMRIAPAGLTRAFLSNSGTEAIEAALKFAIAFTGKHKIVAAKRDYHGRTLGALSATADPKYRAPFEPLPIPATHVPFGNADAIAEAIDYETAAVILEPVQGEAGIFPADDTYLQTVREVCTQRGVVLIADEVQSGFRTGAYWAMSHAGVTPDIAVTAKALGNGFPIGLTLVTEAIAAAIPAGAHGSTFGGNPLACRAAIVTLEQIEERNLLQRSIEIGQLVVGGIEKLNAKKIRQVRGRGLMIGVELKERVTPTIKALQENGVLVLPAGPTTFRLLPPLIWEERQVEELLNVMSNVLAS